MRSFLLVLSLLLGSLQANAADIDFDALKGKVVYLDFWASWCGPCRASFPWMHSMKRRYEDKGLVIIAVNLDQEPKLAEAFLKEFKPDFRVEFDRDGTMATAFGVETMPTSYLIDRNGKARFKHLGFHQDTPHQYEDEIQQLLEEKP
jgi:cytochrome c biogenesis protein CcmG, thiol:disulfide interchange protein DsbE